MKIDLFAAGETTCGLAVQKSLQTDKFPWMFIREEFDFACRAAHIPASLKNYRVFVNGYIAMWKELNGGAFPAQSN